MAWYWLVVMLVLGFRFGMDLQRALDQRVLNLMSETVDRCVDYMKGQDSVPVDKKKPTQWVSIDKDQASA